MLLDSNIIIYSAITEYDFLHAFFARHLKSLCVSEISYLEVVGFHKLTEQDRETFERFFSGIDLLPISTPIIRHAALLRRQKPISLGDCIVAATAICWNIPLATRNIRDFSWIEGLRLCNPFDVL